MDGPERTFCETIAMTGCRISEALALTSDRIDFVSKAIVFRSLKKRGKVHFRAVPVPESLLDTLNREHRLLRANGRPRSTKSIPLWEWWRTKAWQLIKDTMRAAGVESVHAMPKGLRHGFAISALQRGVPLILIQKWLGHANLNTTAIYLQAVGSEEWEFAERMW